MAALQLHPQLLGHALASMDRLLQMPVREQRMKLGEGEQDYQACYQLTG